MPAPPPAPTQPRNPLHGMTLEAVVTALVAHYGWPSLSERIPLRCFTSEPSVASSLKFLRKTPWAREKVEALYLFMLRDTARAQRMGIPPSPACGRGSETALTSPRSSARRRPRA
ncbi:MAG: DUF2132 domain-containing protein [Rubrivivax sp.]|nr:DUF2132 domain-containing protein [Rubrivivax sp.]